MARTVDLQGQTVPADHIASVTISNNSSGLSTASAFLFAAAVFIGIATIVGLAPPLWPIVGLLALFGLILFFIPADHTLVVELTSGSMKQVKGPYKKLSAIKDDIEAAMGAPTNTTVTTTLKEAAELVTAGLISRDEWEAIRRQAAGWSSDKMGQVQSDLSKLESMRSRGLITESEFNDRKWDILAKT